MNRPTCAVIALAALVAGCELVAGIQDKYLPMDAGGTAPSESGIEPADDSTDGGVAHPDATSPETADAPQTADGPSSIDPVADASAPDAMDAGGGNDTPPDAGTTDPSAPCSGQPAFLFCDDFDTQTTVGQGWSWSLSSIDGGSTAFFTAAHTSPPRSVQIVAPVAMSPHNQLLGLDLGALSSQIRLAFDLRVDMDSLSSLPDTAIAQILGARQGTGMEIDYRLRPSQTVLTAAISLDGGPGITIPLPSPPLRTWTRIVIVYDVSAGITIYEDGQPIGSSAAAAAGVPNDTKIQLGMIYEIGAGSATLQMEMDNVVVRGH